MGIIIFTIQVINFIWNIISALKQTQTKWSMTNKKVLSRRFRRPERGQQRGSSIVLTKINIQNETVTMNN